MYVCMYECVCVYIYIYICVCVCVCVCLYIIYVCVCVCMYVSHICYSSKETMKIALKHVSMNLKQSSCTVWLPLLFVRLNAGLLVGRQ